MRMKKPPYPLIVACHVHNHYKPPTSYFLPPTLQAYHLPINGSGWVAISCQGDSMACSMSSQR